MSTFYNREKEQQELRSVLESSPSVVYFIYGPINSGKTALLTKVLNDLPPKYPSFYVNLRGRNVSNSGEFLNVLFSVDRKSKLYTARDYLRAFAKGSVEIVKNKTGIPIPATLFDLLFRSQDKGTDAFKYLEEFFTTLVHDNEVRPVFVLDELQVVRNIANSSGNALLEKLFNFFVHMTKETHLCHCLAATSDSVFIEYIRGNAHLQGRSQQILVDDFDRETAWAVYEQFGFEEKEMVWEYLGGKPGDLMLLKDWLIRNYGVAESLKRMVQDEVSRLHMLEARLVDSEHPDPQTAMELLYRFKEEEEIHFIPKDMKKDAFFWVDQNILFLDSHAEKLRPQGRVVKKAIERLEE